MFDDSDDRTASLMTPARLAQLKVRPRPAPSPAAWLDQLAAGAGSSQVRRLLDLRPQLAALLRGGDVRSIVAGCQALQEALGQVDLALVQPRGWIARVIGGGKDAAARFAAQHERVVQAGDALAAEMRALHKEQQAQGPAAERTLLECEGELRAIDKIMDQGTRWLQDMRRQLKAREGEEGEAVQQLLHEDASRCELLVTRLQLLRAASSATQLLLQRGRTACSARSALTARWRELLDQQWPAWRRQAASLADEAAAQGADGAVVDAARETLASLQAALRSADQEARVMQTQDRVLSDEIAALQGPLQAVA